MSSEPTTVQQDLMILSRQDSKLLRQVMADDTTVEEVLKPDWLLTEKEIRSFAHFVEAVTHGGMDQLYYSKLCAMAIWAAEELRNMSERKSETTDEGDAHDPWSVEHELKTWPQYFIAVGSGEKPFDVRKADRHYEVDNILRLREWCPAMREYTGRILRKRVSYVLRGGQFGIEPGYVAMGLQDV